MLLLERSDGLDLFGGAAASSTAGMRLFQTSNGALPGRYNQPPYIKPMARAIANTTNDSRVIAVFLPAETC
jgi:hypothetical protein